MAESPALPLAVQLSDIYDGVAIYLHPDGRIENRFDYDPWRGSARWQAIEDYIEQNAEALAALIRREWPLPDGAEVQDDQRDAEDG